MSFQLKVNFVKGWPCPSIVDAVADPASGVTTIDEGKIGTLDANGQWILGITNVNQIPYVFWNGAAGDGDHSHVFNPAQHYAQVGWGGIQGIAHINQIEVETAQYAGTPAKGDQLYADVDGVLKVAVNAAGVTQVASKVIVAIVTKGVHKMSSGAGNANVITYIPDNSKRTSV